MGQSVFCNDARIFYQNAKVKFCQGEKCQAKAGRAYNKQKALMQQYRHEGFFCLPLRDLSPLWRKEMETEGIAGDLLQITSLF